LSVDFKVNKLADGANLAANDHNGIVNASRSFIKNIDVKMNGYQVYDCNDVNHVVNIKNVIEYSEGYASSTAANEFFYLDTNRNAEERAAQATFNKGFAARQALLGESATVNTEIPLNRYSFFERLQRWNITFGSIFPLVYFDLTKQKMDIKDGTTKLTFKYKLSGTTTTDYSIYALTSDYSMQTI